MESRTMVSRIAITLGIAIWLTPQQVTALANGGAKPGYTCTKVGARVVWSGRTLTCTKSGSKRVWSKPTLCPRAGAVDKINGKQYLCQGSGARRQWNLRQVTPTPTPTAPLSNGTLRLDSTGLDGDCELLASANGDSIPIVTAGPTQLPSELPDGNESYAVKPGTYSIALNTFNCNGKRYEPQRQLVQVTVRASGETVATLPFIKRAEFVFGRAWNDGKHWNIPMGFHPDDVKMNDLQYRIVGEQGSWETVSRWNWRKITTNLGSYVEAPDTPGIDLEFRFVKTDALGWVTFAWYSPYTCGYNSCNSPSYNVLESPLN